MSEAPNGASAVTGAMLPAVRKRLGLQRRALSAILGVTPAELLDWEREGGALPPDVATRVDQLRALGPEWSQQLAPKTPAERVYAKDWVSRFVRGGPAGFLTSLGLLATGFLALEEISPDPTTLTVAFIASTLVGGSVGMLVSLSARRPLICSACGRGVRRSEAACRHCTAPLDERTPLREGDG